MDGIGLEVESVEDKKDKDENKIYTLITLTKE